MIQSTFIGGLAAQFDATKTSADQYRIGLNVRNRRNVIEPAFKHVKISTASGVHQAAFGFDDQLLLLIAGGIYYIDTGTTVQFLQASGLSATADIVYHENVPAPTNALIGPDRIPVTEVSTTPLFSILQDGVTQPVLVTNDLGVRPARSYAQWTYEDPEYVPIGTLMAFSGSKLFIADTDRTRVFQSVSGRPLDFVLAFDNDTGEPTADAAGSATSPSTARLTALKPAQGGGYVASTRYQTHAAIPQTDFLIYEEPYLQMQTLFPVGAVGQQAFVFANGDTAFVSPNGIQLYNQTAQTLRESNIHPLGRAITDFLVKPIQTAAAVNADDYAFIALETVFGPGILVFDNQSGRFVGIDLTVGLVKEFAVVQQSGLTRLFYITTGNELYEIPLYSGTRATAVVYFGEWCPTDGEGQQDSASLHRLDKAHFAISDLEADGSVSVTLYVDRVAQPTVTIPVSAALPAETTATGSFPLVGSLPPQTIVADFGGTPRGYAIGLAVELSCSAKILSLSVDTQQQALPTSQVVTLIEPETFILAGGGIATNRYTTDFTSVLGRRYVLDASTTSAASVLCGGSFSLPAGGHAAKAFAAGANYAKLSGSARVWDYSGLEAVIQDADAAFILGDTDVTNTYKHLTTAIRDQGVTAYGVAGDYTMGNSTRAADWFGCMQLPNYYDIRTEHVDVYLLNFPLTSGSPPELSATGLFARWLQALVQTRTADRKPAVLLLGVSPADNVTLAAWPFARMGINAVISPGATYRNEVVDGVLFMDIGQADRYLKINARPRAMNLLYGTATQRTDSAYIVV